MHSGGVSRERVCGCGLWQVTHDRWHMKPDVWYVTCYRWHLFFFLFLPIFFFIYIGSTVRTHQKIQCNYEREWDFLSRSRLRLLINQSLYQDWYWDYHDCSLDIKTVIKASGIAVWILRPVLRLSGLQSWYEDRYWDFFIFQYHKLD